MTPTMSPGSRSRPRAGCFSCSMRAGTRRTRPNNRRASVGASPAGSGRAAEVPWRRLTISRVPLVDEGVIDAVHSRLMSGKEATVYVVERAGFLERRQGLLRARRPELQEGVELYRGPESRRATRAIAAPWTGRRRTGVACWRRAGRTPSSARCAPRSTRACACPEPFFLFENVLFMELESSTRTARLPRAWPTSPFLPSRRPRTTLDIFLQVKALLETGRIHGDLSAYTVLMAAQGPTIIDMPQVVGGVEEQQRAPHPHARSSQRHRAPVALRRAAPALRQLRRGAVPPPRARHAGDRRRSRGERAADEDGRRTRKATVTPSEGRAGRAKRNRGPQRAEPIAAVTGVRTSC